MKVSVRKLSELTGFSPATVSNALNHKKGVNAETSAKILETAKELGYLADSRITKIKFVMFKKRGYVVEDTPFFPLMIAGVDQECRLLGYDMVLSHLDRRAENFDEVFTELCADRSSALILLGTEMEDEDIDLIRRLPQPFVVIDYWKEDMTFDAVLINNADSARMATEYLIEKGHREIGYLKGEFRIKPFRSRYAGFETALRKAGISENEAYEIPLSCNLDGAYRDMKRYLSEVHDLPTAFFADNDIIALGAMKAMWEAGIRIPEDVSLVGFDDLSYSSISNPGLTTVRVPKQEMGKMAVRRLRDMMQDGEGSNLHLKTQVCTEFVERDSVRDISGNIV